MDDVKIFGDISPINNLDLWRTHALQHTTLLRHTKKHDALGLSLREAWGIVVFIA